MTMYLVCCSGISHQVEAVTFTQSPQYELRFIGEGGSVVAIFNSFEWLKVAPALVKVEPADTSTTDKPELAGE